MTKKQTFTATTVSKRDGVPPHHFFVSSLGEWKAGYDVAALIAGMKRSGMGFSVWLVPGLETAEYEIQYFAPQVEGAMFLAFYEADK